MQDTSQGSSQCSLGLGWQDMTTCWHGKHDRWSVKLLCSMGLQVQSLQRVLCRTGSAFACRVGKCSGLDWP